MWARLAVAWFLFLPGAYMGVLLYDGGPSAAILSMVAYLAALAALLTYRFRGGAWRRINLTGPTLST